MTRIKIGFNKDSSVQLNAKDDLRVQLQTPVNTIYQIFKAGIWHGIF